MVKVYTEQIIFYSKIYGDRLLNKQSVPKQTIKITFQRNAHIETEDQLKQRLREKFGNKIQIKDNAMKKLLYYDTTIDGVSKKTTARYKKQSKEQAMAKITTKRQELIDDPTIIETLFTINVY